MPDPALNTRARAALRGDHPKGRAGRGVGGDVKWTRKQCRRGCIHRAEGEGGCARPVVGDAEHGEVGRAPEGAFTAWWDAPPRWRSRRRATPPSGIRGST